MKGRAAELRDSVPIALFLVVIAAAGISTKLYQGAARDWVNNSLSGVFYVLFWCLAAALVFPRATARRISVVVFVVTCGLEFLQLWHPQFLERARGTIPGRALLGTSFVWSDFPYYLAGSGLGWMWINRLRSRRPRSTSGRDPRSNGKAEPER